MYIHIQASWNSTFIHVRNTIHIVQLWTNNFGPLQFWKQAGSLVLKLKSMKTQLLGGLFCQLLAVSAEYLLFPIITKLV